MHGVFPSRYKILPFHSNVNFTELLMETVEKSLRRSCRTAINCQGILLPLDRQDTAAVYWRLRRVRLNKPTLPLQHWAGVRPYTTFSQFAESCVFSKQSLFSLHFSFTVFAVSYPLFRRYRIILPSSFTSICSQVSVYSTHLLVSV